MQDPSKTTCPPNARTTRHERASTMPSLSEVLTTRKPEAINDCVQIIDAEVESKSGISGFAIKAGYAVVKGVRPGFIRQAVTDLLPDFAQALDPICLEASTLGRPVADYMKDNPGKVADALLAITDAKAQRAKMAAVKATYEKLRGSAKKNVEAAVPRLAKMVEKFTA